MDSEISQSNTTASDGKMPDSALSQHSQLLAQPNSCSISSWLFQRWLGFAYLAAFASMAFQITALIGHQGILPIDQGITYLHNGGADFFSLGSLCWFNCSDVFLEGLCWGGVVASCLVIAGVLPPLALAACWIFWLSIVNVGQEFLSFQWDILLLETGFLTIFLAPWRVLDWPFRKGRGAEFATPHMVSVWLFRWLLFRLMLESGFCKLNSGDETWRSLTALNFHYHTQPLPTPVAWLTDKFPDTVLKSFTVATLGIELLVPMFIWLKKTRVAAAILLMLLQIVIALTGNYAYFNLLTFALCFFLIDDKAWSLLFKVSFSNRQLFWSNLPAQTVQKVASISCGLIIACFSLIQALSCTTGVPEPVASLANKLTHFYLFNSYGLFATMTTERDEIIVEGSIDGATWKQYEFKYKPGNMFVPPCIVAPLQPRLDWQMWFAALGDVSQSPWFAHFIVKLFQQSPEVLALLKTNPFPDKPPAYLRARLYRYTFSDFSELLSGGQWWRSEYKGEFLPAISADVVPNQGSQ